MSISRFRQWLHELAFGILLRLCERTQQVSGSAAETCELSRIGWATSNVPSASGRRVYPFLVLVIQIGRKKVFTTLSPAQAMILCSSGEKAIKDQMLTFGHTHPMDWDTTQTKFHVIEDAPEEKEQERSS